jgi:hypothetical protein
MSMLPLAAVTAPDSAFDAASVTAALAVAVSVDGASAPAEVASSTGWARIVAAGRAASARLRPTSAGAEGESAGPSAVCCVARRLAAEPEAVVAGLSAAGFARSRFRASPIPATPERERLTTV